MKTPNLQVFYEDHDILVCLKPAKIATQCSKINCPDMVSLLKNHLRQTCSTSTEPYLAVIHRLDQPVKGILVFAKTPSAAKELNHQLQHQEFGKYYRALVNGTPTETEGVLENYLVKDSRTNTSKICSKNIPGSKLARLHYKTVEKGQGFFNLGRGISHFTSSPSTTELDIRLDTGRHHQIRVQLAGIGCPIIGDTKYNSSIDTHKKEQDLCLCAYKLEFRHPKTYEHMCFKIF